MSRIYLIGMMGSGKSTVGKLLADSLGLAFVDTDDLIEREGETITQIFKNHGELAFREKEAQVLRSCGKLSHTVISTGGGMPCQNENIQCMINSGLVIYLSVEPQILAQRLNAEIAKRPLLTDHSEGLEQRLVTMLNQRSAYYKQAHYSIEAGDLSASEVVDIINWLLKEGDD